MEEEGIMTTIQVCRLRFRSRQARAAVWRWSKGGKEEEEEEEKGYRSELRGGIRARPRGEGGGGEEEEAYS